ncbi:urea carboxylase-associated family protein [Cellulomonas sp. H30R-01]|uniref:urea amidolyase associated protein UAAP1 n=1 Tax=Cellulomonas sp. H30R-01 TaxID=2704467 RepID=UPI00138CCB5C|nr:urea amidolyase associated protein UAAP1 [Cellulomonas sp. H30R-01]QHT57224.1 urea carboxylase-associated family protein [Cellulomonas sp. H30R-01]
MTTASAPPTTDAGTGTTAGARAHARAQEAAAAGRVHAMPTLPASAWPEPPAGVDPADLVHAEVVAGGGYTHLAVARGTHVRLTDLDGDACAHVLAYRLDRPWERLNVADTVKVQWQVYLTAGHLLLSDAGRVLASVVQDSSGRQDALFGTTTRARNAQRYGDGDAHGQSPAGRELFALAAAKHGLTRRDLPPSVSFFQGVRVDDEGRPHFEGSAGAGAAVTLRAEVPLLLLVANTAHPLDPRPEFTSSPLEVLAWTGRPTAPDDPLWTATPEGRRAFTHTVADLTARGIA